MTHSVGPLTPGEIDAALDGGGAMARALLARGLIDAAALHLRGATVLVQSSGHFELG